MTEIKHPNTTAPEVRQPAPGGDPRRDPAEAARAEVREAERLAKQAARLEQAGRPIA